MRSGKLYWATLESAPRGEVSSPRLECDPVQRSLPSPGDLLEELAGTSKAPGKPIGMLLLEGGGKTVPVAVILLERLAMILHHIGRIGRSGVDDLVDATLGEATGADHIGNMDPLHPVEPLQLDGGLNGYLNFVNDPLVSGAVYYRRPVPERS